VKVLDPEVLYDSITRAVNADVASAWAPAAFPANDGQKKNSAPAKGVKVARPEPVSIGSRDEFLNFFSGSAGESGPTRYAHGIPQLLRLMNADALNVGSPTARATAASPATVDEKIEALYLAVLARRPTDAQRSLMREYVETRQGNEQAYSDALWILLNSSEFLLNR